MFISDPDFFSIPDPVVKKAPDLGSELSTLGLRHQTLNIFSGTSTRQTRQHCNNKPVVGQCSGCSPIRRRNVFRAEFFSPFLRPVPVLLTGILRSGRQSSRPAGEVKQGQTSEVKQGQTRSNKVKQSKTR
jgi:hypothetical protein